MNLNVDVISDVICPWCYIGKRRLEKAIATLGDKHHIEVRWHPFQLNPTMPKEGISRKQYRTQKFGSWERSMELDSNVEAVGETEGIPFAFAKVERTPNTMDAHRIIELADRHHCQDAVVERLFRAYFIDGQDIGKRETLLHLATVAGLDQHAAETMLATDDGSDMIEQTGELSRRHRIEGVPFFVVNREITLAGAQQPETFLDAFRQVVSASSHKDASK